jgi:alkylation response protein AidB-like acyl-CoA dehydrogenase
MSDAMTTDTIPDVSTPLETARALAPRIRERAAEIEAARRLPADLVMDIATAGLFKVGVSKAEGGFGADFTMPKKGKYGVMVKFKLADGKVRSAKFWYTIK